MKIVLQKLIAASGLASRRQAEEMIRAGRVKLNGQTAILGDRADLKQDKITVGGHLIAAVEEKMYLKLNKPIGYTCTNRNFVGEKNIFDLVNVPARLFAVGRLDKNSRGLILLTNDGDLAEKLAHPRYEHEKVYEVTVKGQIQNIERTLKSLVNGVDIGEGDGRVGVQRAQYLQNGIFVITLNEGKMRQIRRMFSILGMTVEDLKRIAIGSLYLNDLPEGRWEYLTREEIEKLKK